MTTRLPHKEIAGITAGVILHEITIHELITYCQDDRRNTELLAVEVRELWGTFGADIDPRLLADIFFGALDCDYSASSATDIYAAYICDRLAAGHIAPIDAAESIWHSIVELGSVSDEIVPFVGFASEWQDDVEHREAYAEDIRRHALQVGSALWRKYGYA